MESWRYNIHTMHGFKDQILHPPTTNIQAPTLMLCWWKLPHSNILKLGSQIPQLFFFNFQNDS